MHTRFGFLMAAMISTAGAMRDAQAYPTYQRMGYVSCRSCHFLVTGGGTLTPYGKGIASAMSLSPSEPEDPGEIVVHPGAQVRSLFNHSSVVSSLFLMQADALLTVTAPRGFKFDAAAGLGLQRGEPGELVKLPSGLDALVLRRLLASYRVAKEHEVQVGRDFLPAGLNIDDHTVFLRSRNRRGVLDYPTQVRYSFESKRLQLLPYAFLPSYEEQVLNRESGAGFRGELGLDETNSVGVTGLYGSSQAIRRISGGAFTRLSQAHWNGLIAEANLTHRSDLLNRGLDALQQLYYIKPYVAPVDWAELGIVLEHLRSGEPLNERSWAYGPTLNARVLPWASVLADLRRAESGQAGEWIFYSQMFLHL